LSNRQQHVQVGNTISPAIETSVGSPQGSLLSPLIFLIYIADIELWVDGMSIHGYADDVQSCFSSTEESEIVSKLEEEARKMLKFMASNFLSANKNKTGFMMIRNGKSPETTASVSVGGELVQESPHHKILGITVSNALTWNEHVFGKGGVLPSVNKRIGALRRLSYSIPAKYLAQISNSIVTSKLRYGLEIYGSVRLHESEPKCKSQHDLQVALNKAMRIVLNVRLADKIPIRELCEQTGQRTLNQMCAEAQLRLVWSSLHDPESPIRALFDAEGGQTDKVLRSKTRGDIRQIAKTSVGQKNVPYTLIRLWNGCTPSTKAQVKKIAAKREIKNYTHTLPL